MVCVSRTVSIYKFLLHAAGVLYVVEAHNAIDCDFEDAYLCGYVSEKRGKLTWQRINGTGPNRMTSPPSASSGVLAG
jgi:hypothetical protein